MKDEKIVGLYFQRSENAIAETDKKYGGACRTMTYNILGSREDSEECVSDTYMKVWEAIPPSRPEKLGSFVLHIARNLALDLFRRRGTARNGSGYSSVSFDEIAECLPSPESVEGAADRRAVLAALERFLSGLSPDKRSMFVRRYYYCCTFAEIAADMHTTEGRVKMSVGRTREKLRAFLEKEGIEI